MTALYPFKFHSQFKEKIWGGQKINTYLGKDFSPLPNCGESWELSAVDDNISVVKNGALAGKNLRELAKEFENGLLGKKNFAKFGAEFPLLIKFIDANDDLSIQVHPDDELALARHGESGKTEMWYIMQADEGARLISGFKAEVDKNSFITAVGDGSLRELLNEEQVVADDVFFIPAGRIHTIGKGLLLAEIQQTSDITYRVYDFDRTDGKGEKRELHVEQALDALDFAAIDKYKTTVDSTNNPVEIVSCPYFTTNLIKGGNALVRDYSVIDSFIIHVSIGGSYRITHEGNETEVGAGDVVLLPAILDKVEIVPAEEVKILEVYIE